eukprot:CAMPEP_0182441320 /NCGR_PEP_ID=MMETSP1172-20130603/237_1 /TAXON_ID=708627 /ORGANISM="Timspurckia oligopyrenoides, Strain CCMP3278" /LENGTH=349 /DNA_ID=CAMNT_0024635505 /DNA_START=80 /DNA_END=1129 /DNA_ORIENTATION=+
MENKRRSTVRELSETFEQIDKKAASEKQNRNNAKSGKKKSRSNRGLVVPGVPEKSQIGSGIVEIVSMHESGKFKDSIVPVKEEVVVPFGDADIYESQDNRAPKKPTIVHRSAVLTQEEPSIIAEYPEFIPDEKKDNTPTEKNSETTADDAALKEIGGAEDADADTFIPESVGDTVTFISETVEHQLIGDDIIIEDVTPASESVAVAPESSVEPQFTAEDSLVDAEEVRAESKSSSEGKRGCDAKTTIEHLSPISEDGVAFETQEFARVRFAWYANYFVRHRISIIGDWLNWDKSKAIPMILDGSRWYADLDISRGKHRYKFLVDDEWMYDLTQTNEHDGDGNYNNVIEI